MKVAILTAILGNFDTPTDPVPQDLPEGVTEISFHRFTDEDFLPITGLTPRLQYRIPKLFGYEMYPGYDVYIWLDGSMSFTRPDCVKWYLEQLGDADMAFFKHPARNSIEEEVNHIEDHLKKGKPYITARYKNGLHKEFLRKIQSESPEYIDDKLYTSTAFIYRNSPKARTMLGAWWFLQSRYYTCDQVEQPYAVYTSHAKVNIIPGDQYKTPYLSEVSKH